MFNELVSGECTGKQALKHQRFIQQLRVLLHIFRFNAQDGSPKRNVKHEKKKICSIYQNLKNDNSYKSHFLLVQ